MCVCVWRNLIYFGGKVGRVTPGRFVCEIESDSRMQWRIAVAGLNEVRSPKSIATKQYDDVKSEVSRQTPEKKQKIIKY